MSCGGEFLTAGLVGAFACTLTLVKAFVTSELIRTAEALATTGEITRVGAFVGVTSVMSLKFFSAFERL